LRHNDNVDRFGIGLPLLSILILTICIFVTASLLPLSAALTQKKSTGVNALIQGNGLYRLGNYAGAIQYYDKVLATQPKNIGALNNKGLALFHLGNYTQAIQYSDKVLAIDPKNIGALNSKGNSLYQLRNY
jgi:Flp pilus assembly protein TadD